MLVSTQSYWLVFRTWYVHGSKNWWLSGKQFGSLSSILNPFILWPFIYHIFLEPSLFQVLGTQEEKRQVSCSLGALIPKGKQNDVLESEVLGSKLNSMMWRGGGCHLNLRRWLCFETAMTKSQPSIVECCKKQDQVPRPWCKGWDWDCRIEGKSLLCLQERQIFTAW